MFLRIVMILWWLARRAMHRFDSEGDNGLDAVCCGKGPLCAIQMHFIA
jgi:hypothetical protein